MPGDTDKRAIRNLWPIVSLRERWPEVKWDAFDLDDPCVRADGSTPRSGAVIVGHADGTVVRVRRYEAGFAASCADLVGMGSGAEEAVQALIDAGSR